MVKAKGTRGANPLKQNNRSKSSTRAEADRRAPSPRRRSAADTETR